MGRKGVRFAVRVGPVAGDGKTGLAIAKELWCQSIIMRRLDFGQIDQHHVRQGDMPAICHALEQSAPMIRCCMSPSQQGRQRESARASAMASPRQWLGQELRPDLLGLRSCATRLSSSEASNSSSSPSTKDPSSPAAASVTYALTLSPFQQERSSR